MTDKEVQMLGKLREFAREQYEAIDGKQSPMAMMPAQQAAYSLSSIVKSLDDVLKGKIKFK